MFGIAAAVFGAGVETGGALLLFAEEGFLSTFAFLIALVLASLAVGVWVGRPTASREGARTGVFPRGWFGLIAAFMVAGLFGQLWMGFPPVRNSAVGQALGVVFFLAEPAYMTGALFTAGWARHAGRGSALPAAALAGAAFGVFLTGSFLIRKLDPAVIFYGGGLLLLVAAGIERGATRRAGAWFREREGSMADRSAIVTGVGGEGQVAYAVAERLLAAGARVLVTDISPAVEACARALAATAAGEAVVSVSADLTKTDDAARVVDAARERFGRVDVLVNTAGGLSVMEPLATTDQEEWHREQERNAETAFLMSRAALPLLRESRGSIVNFAAPAGRRGVAGLGAYSAAKAGVIALTRVLALEEKEHGVRVNAIAPGLVDTEQNRQAVSDPDSVGWVTREQIAAVVLFLAGDDASGISGQTIEVAGDSLE